MCLLTDFIRSDKGWWCHAMLWMWMLWMATTVREWWWLFEIYKLIVTLCKIATKEATKMYRKNIQMHWITTFICNWGKLCLLSGADVLLLLLWFSGWTEHAFLKMFDRTKNNNFIISDSGSVSVNYGTRHSNIIR